MNTVFVLTGQNSEGDTLYRGYHSSEIGAKGAAEKTADQALTWMERKAYGVGIVKVISSSDPISVTYNIHEMIVEP